MSVNHPFNSKTRQLITSSERTIFQSVVFWQVVQVARLHTHEVIYLAFVSMYMPLMVTPLPTRAGLMFTMVDRGRAGNREVTRDCGGGQVGRPP